MRPGQVRKASLFSDGSSVQPYSLQISSTVAGQVGNLQIDASSLGLNLTQTVAGQDALLLVNNGGSNGTLVSSPTNTFSNVLAGATLTVNGSSSTPVSISATTDTTNLVATIQALVNSYNQIQSDLTTLTAYDTTSNTGGTLQGDPTALQLETQIASLITNPSAGFGSVQSLIDLGVTVQPGRHVGLRLVGAAKQVRLGPNGRSEFSEHHDNGAFRPIQDADRAIGRTNEFGAFEQDRCLEHANSRQHGHHYPSTTQS